MSDPSMPAQPPPGRRAGPMSDRSTRLVRAIEEVEGNHDALIMVRCGDVIGLIGEIKSLTPTPIDWPARFRAAAKVAKRMGCPYEQLQWMAAWSAGGPPDEVEAIGRKLLGKAE